MDKKIELLLLTIHQTVNPYTVVYERGEGHMKDVSNIIKARESVKLQLCI
jgi:hypothetical protein